MAGPILFQTHRLTMNFVVLSSEFVAANQVRDRLPLSQWIKILPCGPGGPGRPLNPLGPSLPKSPCSPLLVFMSSLTSPISPFSPSGPRSPGSPSSPSRPRTPVNKRTYIKTMKNYAHIIEIN